jgi:hypothetical protein
LFGQGDCRVAHTASEVDDAFTGDVADQAAIEARMSGPSST